jgi:RNA polymerase sigma-B factor
VENVRPNRAKHPGEVEQLFLAYRKTGDPRIRQRLVMMHERLVRSLANKFAHRGEPMEDLVQIGCIGLIMAIDRYQPERGTRFISFAVPTIVGEIQRHFRDRTWDVRAPRWLVELQPQVVRANHVLLQELGRPPTVAEIADCVGTSEEAALQAIEIGHTCGALSLDSDFADPDQSAPHALADHLGAPDHALEKVEVLQAVREAIERLGRREREVIELRFFHELTQTEVAARLGISQMHVSRLQHRALAHLRSLLFDAGEARDPVC